MSDPDRSLSLHQRTFGTSCSRSRLDPGPVPEEAWLVNTTPGTFVVTVEKAEPHKGLQIDRYCTLEELPVLVFGVMTVAYIVLSLAKLAL